MSPLNWKTCEVWCEHVEKNKSDHLENKVISENTTEKFITNVENDLISSESAYDEDNNGSDLSLIHI